MTDITPEQLSAYLDDALDSAERATVDRALADSPALRRELEALRRTQAWVRELPAPGVPTGFEQRVLRTIQKPRARTNWWIVAPSVFGAAATALLMVMVIRQDRPRLMDKARAATLNEVSLLGAKTTAPITAGARGRAEKTKEAPKDVHPLPLAGSRAGSTDADGLGTTAPRVATADSTLGASVPAPMRRAQQAPESVAAQEKEEARGFAAGFADASPAENKTRREGLVGLKKAAAPSVLEWRGDDSGVTEFREIVVRSEEGWRILWKEHMAHRVPPPPVPPVDFASTQVVGVFLGQRPSGGYAVEILSMDGEGSEQRVTYRETRPPANTMQITVLTQPFHLRVTPRRDGPVRFERKK